MPDDAARLLFTNAAGQLQAEPAGLLRVTWVATPRELAATQALFGQMGHELRQHGWSRMLIDQSVMRPFSGPEQAWITTEWLPQAVREGGYRHGAIVVSADVLTRLATAFITTHVQGLPLTYRSFDTEAEALRWLLTQPATP